jgi:hypothetical protein
VNGDEDKAILEAAMGDPDAQSLYGAQLALTRPISKADAIDIKRRLRAGHDGTLPSS